TKASSPRPSLCPSSRPSQRWSIASCPRIPRLHRSPRWSSAARSRHDRAPAPPVDLFSMDHEPKILIWNVRGLNARARRTAIRSLVVTANASIVCLQETKMTLVCSSTVLEALGSEFDDYVYLPADGTRGGILLAWKSREVAISIPEFTSNTLRPRCPPHPARARRGGSPWSMGRSSTPTRSPSFRSYATSGRLAMDLGCFAAISSSSTVTKTRATTTSIAA
uniref:Endonuclease/exonuclease/phosphatase domain-containing protein n=1 Tax=Aegilops tauschii subsp. strangulata TaxID=200361 RepID=A0A453SZ66_AEGTS